MSELKEHNGNGIRYAMYLSAPKGGSAQMLRDPSGDWVSYEEYARLKAEVERLQNNCDYLDQKLDEEIDKSAMLCGQVERLRKAGDDLVLSVEWRNVVVNIPATMSLIESVSFLEVSEKCKCNLHNFDDDIKAWQAAKKGNPTPTE